MKPKLLFACTSNLKAKKKHVNKKAKTKIGDPPGNFVLKALTSPPPRPWIFNRVYLWLVRIFASLTFFKFALNLVIIFNKWNNMSVGKSLQLQSKVGIQLPLPLFCPVCQLARLSPRSLSK
jgi:hypothetical protein